MPRRTNPDKTLSYELHVRLTPADYASLSENARQAGLNVSEYVRRRTLGRPVIAKGDAAICRELVRLGGLLKHLYNQSGRDKAFGAASKPVLESIYRAVEDLSKGDPE